MRRVRHVPGWRCPRALGLLTADHPPIIRLTAFTIAGLTSVLLRRPRFRFVVFFVKMWLFIERFRFTFPEAVSLNRFLAPR